MSDRVEIQNYQRQNKKSLIGTFDLQVKRWGVTIRGMCHFKKENREWIGFSTKWDESDGEGKYVPLIEFVEKPHEREFKRIVLEELHRAI